MIPIRKKGKFEQPRIPVEQRTAVETKPEPQKAPRQKKSVRLPLILVSAAALAAAAAIGLYVYGASLQAQDTIFPNVYLAGVPVGGMTVEEAAASVEAAVTVTEKSPVLQVELPDQTLLFEPEQTTYAADPLAAAKLAKAYGRSGNAFQAVLSYLRKQPVEIDLTTGLDLDEAHIRGIIDAAAEKAYTEMEPSSITYNEEQKNLVIKTGTPSLELDADSLYEAVCQAYADGSTEPIQWAYTQELPEPIDLAEYRKTLCAEPVDAYYDADNHTIVEDVPGLSFDLEDAQAKVDQAGYGKTITVKLKEVPAALSAEELDQQMFGVKLESRSSYYWSWQTNRTENLRLACEGINGTIINPGEIFSFNEVLGERTAEKGYLSAPVFGGEGNMAEGGGICQVASTIFYTVLYLDLETVQRVPHSYSVDYVPLGMDAAIYWDEGQDYQFRNTRENPIRIEANIDDGHVNISFWGVKENDNYVVMTYEIFESWDSPDEELVNANRPAGTRELIQYASKGMKVNAFQSVFNGDHQLIKTERYYSYYYSRPRIYEVSPDMATGAPVPGTSDGTNTGGSGGTAVPSTPAAPDEPDTPDEPFIPAGDPLGG